MCFVLSVSVSVRKANLRYGGWRNTSLFHGRIFSSFLSSCLLEAITLGTIDGYSKHYEKYQFTLIKDLPVVLEVKYIQRVMQAHRPLKSPMKD